MSTEYQYADQPLTPGIAIALITELFSGKIAERHKIVDAVVRTHLERRGLESRAKDTPRVIKKALSLMERSGSAVNPSFGQWRVRLPEGGSIAEPVVEEVEVPSESQDLAKIEKASGSGDDSVYVYYYDAYRAHAEAAGKKVFACKIGRSERDPLSRVLSQASTALPEYPRIARLYRTTDGSALESAIHCILTLRGRDIDSSPGSEWFLTSPDEVDKIVEFISEQNEEAESRAADNPNDAQRSV